jgi:CRISPR-associated protein Cmr1
LEKISLDCVVLTPMFLAGADTQYPEIRAASIKGMLRFWWRALHANLPFDELRRKETEIFGGAGENAGRSKIEIVVKKVQLISSPNQKLPNKNVKATSRGKPITVNLFDYLAYGVVEYQKGFGQVLKRPFIEPESSFTLEITFSDIFKREIVNTLRAFLSFGNLGAKSHNGFGSFYTVDQKLNFDGKQVKIEKLSELAVKTQSADYSAFTTQSKLYKTDVYATANEAWGKIGETYRDVRLSLDPHYKYDKRKFLAQPIVQMKNWEQPKLDRYSKPYFLKVLPDKGGFIGYILYLPSRYGVGHNKIAPREYSMLDSNAKRVHNQINQEFQKRLTEVK